MIKYKNDGIETILASNFAAVNEKNQLVLTFPESSKMRRIFEVFFGRITMQYHDLNLQIRFQPRMKGRVFEISTARTCMDGPKDGAAVDKMFTPYIMEPFDLTEDGRKVGPARRYRRAAALPL